MAEPTLSEVFGSGSSQTDTQLIISKADLSNLTASASNTAESLLIAIMLKAQSYLSQTKFDANIDQSVYISPGFSSFTTRGANNDAYRIDQLTINASKIDSGSTLDPDDY